MKWEDTSCGEPPCALGQIRVELRLGSLAGSGRSYRGGLARIAAINRSACSRVAIANTTLFSKLTPSGACRQVATSTSKISTIRSAGFPDFPLMPKSLEWMPSRSATAIWSVPAFRWTQLRRRRSTGDMRGEGPIMMVDGNEPSFLKASAQ